MYDDHLEEFAGQPVKDYNTSADWSGAQLAYRLREDYDDEVKIQQRLDALLAESEVGQLSALIIGTWSGACEGDDSNELVESLVNAAPQLVGLRHLFLGDITYEECELSWINQSDLSPILAAYPQLETLCVRGGEGLKFSRIEHPHLKTLVVQTGGLSRSTIREIFQCDFPALERLELYLGEENYGFDGSVEDLQPLLTGKIFPSLKVLGLMNSVISNDIAAVVVNSPIVERLDELDLSYGNLDSEGAQSLLGLEQYKNLKRVTLEHHYASQAAVDQLKSLPFEVVVDEAQEQDEDDWRPILHAE